MSAPRGWGLVFFNLYPSPRKVPTTQGMLNICFMNNVWISIIITLLMAKGKPRERKLTQAHRVYVQARKDHLGTV